MGTIQGMITSYDVKENKVDVSPVLGLLKLPETPLLNQIGIDTDPVVNTRYEWWDDVLPALKVTLAAAYTAGGGTITVDDGTKLKVGNILKIDDSIYRVTAINGNTITITVVSNDADHAIDSEVLIIGDANKEGAEYVDTAYEQKVLRYNVTQIFDDFIKITGTQKAIEQYVKENVFLDEVQRKLEKLKRLLERSAWLGVRVVPTDNQTPRLFGGIKWFITNENGITASGTFNEANFNAFLKQIYDASGTIREAWMNPATKAYFNALDADKVVYEKADQIYGRVINAYLSDYGTLELKTSPHIPENIIIVFDSSKVKIKPLKGRAFFYEELAKTGDYTKGQIVGEYTLEFHNPDVAGIFTVTG